MSSSNTETKRGPVGIESFDVEKQATIASRTKEVEQLHTAYLAAHPQLQQVLHEFMQALLFHKPDDALAFMSQYFNSQREKREPYVPP